MDGAVIAAVVIGAVFLLGMVAAAGYAARMLPSAAPATVTTERSQAAGLAS